MMGVEMGSGNGERYTFIYSRVGYVGGSLDTVVLQFPRIRSSFERYTYRYKFVYERKKKNSRTLVLSIFPRVNHLELRSTFQSITRKRGF